jgi:hypothetical protein
VVAVRRQDVETFSLTLPPSTDDELPSLVDAHIAAESATLGEDAIVDFVALDEDSHAPRRVAAAAIHPASWESYHRAADQAGLRRPRLVVRPYATASLYGRLRASQSEAVLLVNQLAEEIDLAVVANGKLWYWRTVHSQSTTGSEAFATFLKAELARTVAVAPQHLPGGEEVKRAILVCRPHEVATFEDAAQSIDLPVETLDSKEITNAVDAEQRDDICAFAPLFGMLCDEADGVRPAIDLLRPRRPAVTTPRRRPLILGIAGAVLAVLLGGYWANDQIQTANAEVEALRQQLQALREQVKKLAVEASIVNQVETWQSSSVVWLDELRDLSAKFPPPGDAVVLDFTASPNRGGGASVRLHGEVRDPAVVTELDRTLGDEFRTSLSRNFREEPQEEGDDFRWRFESSITTVRRPYVDPATAEKRSVPHQGRGLVRGDTAGSHGIRGDSPEQPSAESAP